MLIAFGALVAAGLPVLLAFSGVLATIGLSGLGEPRRRGRRRDPVGDPADRHGGRRRLLALLPAARARGAQARRIAARRAAEGGGTSGHAVFISGLTVLIAMAGMLFTGNAVFTSIAVGAMLMVAVALIGSLSILPAVLAKLGHRVDKGRIPYFGRRSGGESRVWSFVLDRVMRRPALAAALSGGALLALALPALTLHTQLPSFTDLPKSLPIVRTYESIQQAFPGAQTPAKVVVAAPTT